MTESDGLRGRMHDSVARSSALSSGSTAGGAAGAESTTYHTPYQQGDRHTLPPTRPRGREARGEGHRRPPRPAVRGATLQQGAERARRAPPFGLGRCERGHSSVGDGHPLRRTGGAEGRGRWTDGRTTRAEGCSDADASTEHRARRGARRGARGGARRVPAVRSGPRALG